MEHFVDSSKPHSPIHAGFRGRGCELCTNQKTANTDVVNSQMGRYPTPSRAEIYSGVLVSVGPRALVSKHILPVVRLEWSYIFPLREAHTIAVSQFNPPVFAHTLTVANKRAAKPGNHCWRFRSGVMVLDIVVGRAT